MNFHEMYYNLISKNRKERVEKYIFIMDKLRAIYGEILLRYAIIENAEISNESISFSHNPFGKPLLENSNLHVNLSHSGDIVICVVSNAEVGIDIEKHTNSFKHIINFMHEDERKKLILEGMNKDALFQQWCLKESYIKYTGKGLFCKLDSFKILFNEKDLLIEESNLEYSPKFELLNISEGYSSAICYKYGKISKISKVSEADLLSCFKAGF